MVDVKAYTVRVPNALLRRLKAIAEREQRSANSQILVALTKFADEYEAGAVGAKAGDGAYCP